MVLSKVVPSNYILLIPVVTSVILVHTDVDVLEHSFVYINIRHRIQGHDFSFRSELSKYL